MKKTNQKKDDEFLKELQKDCLNDNEDYFTLYREGLKELEKDPVLAFCNILKVLHSLKGNIQAVGFKYCGEYIHDLESILGDIEKLAKENKIDEKNIRSVELFLSQALDQLESYFNELKEDQSDSIELKDAKNEPLKRLVSICSQVALQEAIPANSSEKKPKDVVADTSNPKNILLKPEVTELPTISAEKKSEVKAGTVENNDQQQDYLLCWESDRYFAIPIEYVIEVVKSQAISALPHARSDVLGLLNLRSEALPILNLKSTFSKKLISQKSNQKAVQLKNAYIIVSQMEEKKFGFEVEQVHEVISLNRNTFQEFVESFQSGEESLVNCISLTDNKTILIVDLHKALVAV